MARFVRACTEWGSIYRYRVIDACTDPVPPTRLQLADLHLTGRLGDPSDQPQTRRMDTSIMPGSRRASLTA